MNDVLIIFTNRIDAFQLENVLKRAYKLKKNKVEIITVYFQRTKMPWNIKDEFRAIASIPENVLTLQSNNKLRRTLKRRICPSARAMREYCLYLDLFTLLKYLRNLTGEYLDVAEVITQPI